MKALICLAAFTGAAFFTDAAVAAEVPQGTHVLLRMMNTINTRTAAEGDRVYLRTESPIASGGQIVVPAGSYVQGVVTRAKRSGKVAGRAELQIKLETLTLASGKSLAISPKLSSVDDAGSSQKVEKDEGVIKQGSDYGKDARTIGILAGSGAATGAIVERGWTGAGIGAGAGGAVGIATALLTRGREVELRQGSTLDVVFDRAIAIE